MNEEEMMTALSALKLAAPRWAPSEINQSLAHIWLKTLKDFDRKTIVSAFSRAMQNLTEWPPPATIKRMCQGSDQTDEEMGGDIAARIEGAITTCGYTGYDRAMEKIGPIGAQVVKLCGGWQKICNTTYDQLPSARKQWRDMATQCSRKIYRDNKITAPALPKSNIMEEALRIAQGFDK